MPARRRGQAQPRVLRGLRLGRAWPPSSGCARASRPTCRSSPTPSAATSRSTAARQAVALFDALGVDAVTVNPYLGERAIAPLLERLDRFAYVLCRTSNPGRRRAPGPARRGGPRDRRPGGAAPRAGRPASRRAGDRAAPSGSSSGRPPPDELAAIRARRARVWPSSCPASAPRAAPSTPVLARRSGDRRARPAGRPGGGLLVNVSRGIAGAGRRRPLRRTPSSAIATAAADWARTPPCATLADRETPV